MKDETERFITDREFNELFVELHKTHKPIKAKFEKEYLEAIGLLIAKFQRLESTIKSFVGMILNISNEQQLVSALLTKHSFGNLIIVLECVAIEKKFHRHADLMLLLKKALKAEEIRNQIVHSVWTSGGRFKTTLKSGTGVKTVYEAYTSSELLNIADTVDKIDTAISALEFDYIEYCQKKGELPNGVKIIK